jgi:DNA-binding response OmpR family regulator
LLVFIKQLTNIHKIPTLVLCSHLSEDLQVALLDSGVEGILSKPYSIRVLQAYIRNIQRRCAGLPSYISPTLSHGGITLEPARRIAYAMDRSHSGLLIVFRLLSFLMCILANHSNRRYC